MKPLWNRNFKILILGTFLSAIGGIGLNIALGIIVYDQTQSTLLSAAFTALSMIPNYVLPLIVGPYVDRRNPLKVLVANEVILASIFLISGIVVSFTGFNYFIYLIITLVISSFGIVSELSSSNVIPQVMPKSHFSQGNAILGTIYPLSRFIVTPIAMLLFKTYGVAFIFIGYSVLTLLDAYAESKIDCDFEYDDRIVTQLKLKDYVDDMREGVKYLRKDKALMSVLIGFSLVMFTTGVDTLTYPFFNQSTFLTDDNYALLLSIQSLGYVIGGLIHYRVRIPDKLRFTVAIIVYVLFASIDGFFLFYPFIFMVLSKFLLGIFGTNSANIRISAVQHRVQATMRAKVNALFGVAFTLSGIIGQMLAGVLGEYFPLPLIQLGFNGIYMLAIIFAFYPKKNKVKELYNFSSKITQSTS